MVRVVRTSCLVVNCCCCNLVSIDQMVVMWQQILIRLLPPRRWTVASGDLPFWVVLTWATGEDKRWQWHWLLKKRKTKKGKVIIPSFIYIYISIYMRSMWYIYIYIYILMYVVYELLTLPFNLWRWCEKFSLVWTKKKVWKLIVCWLCVWEESRKRDWDDTGYKFSFSFLFHLVGEHSDWYQLIIGQCNIKQ